MPSIYLILLIILLDEVTEGNLNIQDMRFKPQGLQGPPKGASEDMIANLKGTRDSIMASIQGILDVGKGNAGEQVASLQKLLEKNPGVNADDLVASIQGLLGKPSGVASVGQGLLGKPSGVASVGEAKENTNSNVMQMYRNGQPIIQPRIMRVVVPEGVTPDEEKRMISHVAALNKNMPIGLLSFMTYRNRYTVLNLPPHLRKILLPFPEK